jgi:hypothetical protein
VTREIYVGILMEDPLFLRRRQFKNLEEQQKTRGVVRGVGWELGCCAKE